MSLLITHKWKLTSMTSVRLPLVAISFLTYIDRCWGVWPSWPPSLDTGNIQNKLLASCQDFPIKLRIFQDQAQCQCNSFRRRTFA